MPRFQYRCPECDGTIDAARVERRQALSGGRGVGGRAAQVVLVPRLLCEADGGELIREEYTPKRREVRAD